MCMFRNRGSIVVAVVLSQFQIFKKKVRNGTLVEQKYSKQPTNNHQRVARSKLVESRLKNYTKVVEID